MANHIAEHTIDAVDPRRYRVFLAFNPNRDHSATAGKMVVPAFYPSPGTSGSLPTDELFVELEEHYSPASAARVRWALRKRMARLEAQADAAA